MMSKQRPSERTLPAHPAPRSGKRRGSKTAWIGNVFRNSYTRAGRQMRVKGWSAKIQHRGTRKTFSLAATNRADARIEAQALYQTILTQGWDAVASRTAPSRTGTRSDPATESSWPRTDIRHWRQRLLRRPHPQVAVSTVAGELSVRIDHAGRGRYFPLGASDGDAAAARARDIYLSIVRDGWDHARRVHACEVTIALHWAGDPLAWTYATIHTAVSQQTERAGRRKSREEPGNTVVVIEPDPAVRRALAACVGRQGGFVCAGSFESAAEALSGMAPRPPRLVLANHLLPDIVADGLGDSLRRISADSFTLFYSVHDDSDQLFKATPGGASGYLLKRTSSDRLFEPILDLPAGLAPTASSVTTQVRRYFQNVLLGLSGSEAGKEMAKLTHREHEILNLLSRGCVDKEIADVLRISVWTVHGHLKRIYEKLGVHTRTEAAIKYLQK